jgi:serine/threonine protein kinase
LQLEDGVARAQCEAVEVEDRDKGALAGFLAPGVRLGRYQLIRQLRVGGMAEIYLASATGIEGFRKRVVLKRILPQYATQDSYVEMFLDEARLAATLDHPNIAQVYDVGQQVGNYYFTMEYIRGEDLRTILATEYRSGRRVPLGCAVTIGIGVCAGLHYAHGKAGSDGEPLHIVHRDVSLSNILVSYDGAVKIVDFGVAKFAAKSVVTEVGTVKGKLAYMSPEQCRGDDLDHRSDIFAIGIVLYELTTGTRLFKGDNELAVLRKITDGELEPPSRRRPDYPDALEHIVLRALARDPAERYQSAQDLQRELEDFAREHRLSVSSIDLADYMHELFADRVGLETTPSVVLSPRRAMARGTLWPTTQAASPANPTPVRRPSRALPRQPAIHSGRLIAGAAVLGAVAGLAFALGSLAATPLPELAAPPEEPAVHVRAGADQPRATPIPTTAATAAEHPSHLSLAKVGVFPSTPEATAPRRGGSASAVAAAVRRPAPDASEPAPNARQTSALAAPPGREALRASSAVAAVAAPPAPASSTSPVPTPVPASPVLAPPVPTPPVPTPPAPAPTPAVVLDAQPALVAVDVAGALQNSVVRRAIGRVVADFRSCYQQAARRAQRNHHGPVTGRFVIGELNRVHNVAIGASALPGLSPCLRDATARIRSRVPPDIGVVHVSFTVDFLPIR